MIRRFDIINVVTGGVMGQAVTQLLLDKHPIMAILLIVAWCTLMYNCLTPHE